MPTWKFSEVSRNVHRFDIKLPHSGDEQWFLLQSDVHWDSPHCDRDLLRKHLDLADKRNAPILDIGDFYDAMQGKWDKRSSKADLRPELCGDDYLDALVGKAAQWLEPYSHLLTLRGDGNHETSVLKRHETHLVDRLCDRLKNAGAKNVRHGGFSGFVRFHMVLAHNRRYSFTYWYHHGYGGGGPVTRGVIQTNRQAVYLADADIVHNGHTHDTWQVPIARIRLSKASIVEHCRQVHVRTAGYKQEYGAGVGGWHIERGGPPKPLGAAWLRIFNDVGSVPKFEITEAA